MAGIDEKQKEQNRKIAYDYYISQGLTPIQASALIGNFEQESGLNPTAKGDQSIKGGSRGIAQWNRERLQKLRDTHGFENSELFGNQVAYALAELKSPAYKEAYKRLKNAKTIEEATLAISDKFEVPNPKFAHNDKRIAYAVATHNKFNPSNLLNSNYQDVTYANNVAPYMNPTITPNIINFDNATQGITFTGEETEDPKLAQAKLLLAQKQNEEDFLNELFSEQEKQINQAYEPQETEQQQEPTKDISQTFVEVNNFVENPLMQQGGAQFGENITKDTDFPPYENNKDYASAMRGMMKSKMAEQAAFGNPAAKRLFYQIVPPYQWTGGEQGAENNKGNTGTHYMGSYGNEVRPGLQEINGRLQYVEHPQFGSKENFPFDREQDAEYFAEHYKEVAPMMKSFNKMQQGGKAPIYVESKNDPRYRAYQDSLQSYVNYEKINEGWKNIDNKKQYTTGDKVKYGTPEYKEAYDKGEVITNEGVHSPIALDEVLIQNNYKRPRGFWEQYRDKIVEENKDAGVLGAIAGTPMSAITSLPQLAMMKAITGEMQRPSEAIGFNVNKDDSRLVSFGKGAGNFVIDAVTDPANLIGAGVLTKEKALTALTRSTEEGLLSNTYKINPWAFKPNPEAYYRTLGKEGFEDAMQTGVIRPKQYHNKYSPELGKRIDINEPEFPEGSYFNKSGLYSTNKQYNPEYITEVVGQDALFEFPKRAVFNENIRVAPSNIPIENAQFYKRDWLKGYKPIETPKSNLNNQLPPPEEFFMDVNNPSINLSRGLKPPKQNKPHWEHKEINNLIESTPLRKAQGDETLKRVSIPNRGEIDLKLTKGKNGEDIYYFSANMPQGGLDAGRAYKHLEQFIPKGSKILEKNSLSTDSFYNITQRAKNPNKFTWVDEGDFLPLNNAGKNKIFSNSDKAIKGSLNVKFEDYKEAKKALEEFNSRITLEGMPKAKLSKIVEDFQPVEGGDFIKKTTFGIDVPNIGLIKNYKQGGKVDWISKKIQLLENENTGRSHKQNIAIAYSMYDKKQQGGKIYPPISNFYKGVPQEKILPREENKLQLLIDETNLVKQDREELSTTGQIKNPRSLHYKKLAPKQTDVKVQTKSDAELEGKLGLERPLVYLANPEKLLGDIGIPNKETSELDRQAVMANRFNPNQTRKEQFLNSVRLGLGYVPEATVNTALAATFMPEGSGILGLTNEVLNPFAGMDNALFKNIKTSVAPEVRQGLITNGLSLESSAKNTRNIPKNLEDLIHAKDWAKQYGYELPENLERIAQSDELTNRTIRGMMNRHNTFVRGVSTNWDELAQRNPEILRHLEGKGFDLSTKEGTKAAAEYMSTHIPIDTGYGRASLNDLVFDRGQDALYTSNSIPTAEGYTYGQGYITKVKKPTDFSSLDRKDWITQNNPQYYKNLLPKSKSYSPRDLGNLTYEKIDELANQKRITETERQKFLKYFDESNRIKKDLMGRYKINESTPDNIFDNYLGELNKEKENLSKNLFYEDYSNKILRTERKTIDDATLQNDLLPIFNKFPEAKAKFKEFVENNNLNNEVLNSVKGDEWFRKFASENNYLSNDNPYAHYLHIGTPGEKILEPIKSWEITPDIWKNKSRAHTNTYSKKLSALEQGGIIQDNQGQRKYPNQITKIEGSTMATDGYGNIPLYVIPDVGEPKMVYPNSGEHVFEGATSFIEYPNLTENEKQFLKEISKL